MPLEKKHLNKIKTATILMVVFGILLLGIKSSYSVLAYSTENKDFKKIDNKISEQELRIKTLKEQAAKYQKTIEAKQLQIKTLEEQISILNNRITKKELDIEITKDQIKQTKDKITKKTLEIDDKKKEIDTQKEKIIDFIRLIYKNDQKSYLEVLILNNSFSDFFNNLTFTENIEHKLKDILDEIISAKESMEEDKDLLEREELNLEKLNIKLTQEKDKLSEEKDIKRTIIRETKNSEKLFKKLLSKSKQEQIEADSDILKLEKQKRDFLKQQEEKEKLLDDSSILSWPVDPSRGISSYFHDPDYPYRYIFEHPAIDIRVSQGTPIKSPTNGYVGRIRNAGMGYNYIMIIHDNGISTVYGHVSKILVKEDEFVTRGQIIGKSGGAPGTPGAGRLTTGAHLHFEVRLNGIPVNPLDYLP